MRYRLALAKIYTNPMTLEDIRPQQNVTIQDIGKDWR